MDTDYCVGIEELTVSYKEAQISNLLHASMKFKSPGNIEIQK